MSKRLISSLSKCDMCRHRTSELFTQGGLDVCGSCNSTLKSCDRQRGTSGEPKEVAGCFSPRYTVRKSR